MEILIELAKAGRKPVNPVIYPQAPTVPVKLPIVYFTAHPKGPKGAKGLNQTTINLGPPLFLKTNEKVRNLLKSTIVKNMKNLARKKGFRGIKHSQQCLEPISRICISCKEIGNPVIEWTRVESHVMEKNRRSWNKFDEKYDDLELHLFYNHPPGSPRKRCRICKVETFELTSKSGKKIKRLWVKPFPNSKLDLRDLRLQYLLRHIANKDPGYEKFSQIFNINFSDSNCL